MGKVGFKTSWMQGADVAEIEVPAPIQNIANEQPVLSPAHIELVTRLKLTETIITGKTFAKLSAEKKLGFLEEYKWLVSINAQLGGI
jgi:hypothetical protein